MNINGISLRLDISNNNDLNRYKEALNRLQEGIEDVKNSDVIFKYKTAFYSIIICKFFNELFEEDTDKQLFGDKPYYDRCLNALKQLQNEVIIQKKKLRGLMIKFPNKNK
ncbi:DUF6673 family protein [Clostridium combesii]|uniref:DUF6673 domain-containing protein n=1 Tax=Clostridium combesii TaxID=39481 RepID=A0A2G7HLJ3_9CLOT|nr:DUF6673 family protein [Clostridium combesii]PIH05222.1 hypothetical protein CS538_05175 [Clostridium combesii]